MAKAYQAPRLPIVINESSRIPIQRQLIDQMRELIVSLRLMPGQLLPSTRDFATAYGVSRATAVRVYKDLMVQGYIETIEGRGTFVRRRFSANTNLMGSSASYDIAGSYGIAGGETSPAGRGIDVTAAEPVDGEALFQGRLSGFAGQLMQLKVEPLTAHDFPELNHGCSPSEFLPLQPWKQAMLNSARHVRPDEIDFGAEPFGYRPLREALRDYLSRSRMIDCRLDNLLVCSSSTFLLHLLGDVLIDPADVIAFPEPGPIYARHTFYSLGANVIPLPVDGEGLTLDVLGQLDQPPKIVYLNSSHQEPLGTCLSLARREAILDWAEQNGVIIIEDDYDAEYRYAGAPLPSLRALSKGENVVYLSSFWRSLYPLVNVSYMVLPAALVAVFTQAWHLTQHAFHTHFPFIDQKALTELLNKGEYERHLHKNQTLFANRWRSCVHQMTVHFGKTAKLASESGPYHLLVQFLGGSTEEQLLKAAQQAGLAILPAHSYYAAGSPPCTFLLPFAYLNEDELAERIKRFRSLLV